MMTYRLLRHKRVENKPIGVVLCFFEFNLKKKNVLQKYNEP